MRVSTACRSSGEPSSTTMMWRTRGGMAARTAGIWPATRYAGMTTAMANGATDADVSAGSTAVALPRLLKVPTSPTCLTSILHPHSAKVLARFVELRIELQGPLELLDGRRIIALRVIRDAQIVVGGGIGRFRFDFPGE